MIKVRGWQRNHREMGTIKTSGLQQIQYPRSVWRHPGRKPVPRNAGKSCVECSSDLAQTLLTHHCSKPDYERPGHGHLRHRMRPWSNGVLLLWRKTRQETLDHLCQCHRCVAFATFSIAGPRLYLHSHHRCRHPGRFILLPANVSSIQPLTSIQILLT